MRTARVLIVAEHASARFGGEAMLPLHYFRLLREQGVEAWLLSHARTRDELMEALPEHRDRLCFVPDTAAHRALWRVGRRLPARVDTVTSGALSHLLTQTLQRRHARRLVAEHRIDVVHEPIPVSPRQPSALHDLGAPVLIGPMNGGMAFPAAFRHEREGRLERAVVALGRLAADVANVVVPGKRRAAVLLVANERTRAALPRVTRGVRVVELVENGVDLNLFQPRPVRRARDGGPRFAFVGRLVDWKAVDLLLEAFVPVARACAGRLDLCGDGPERARLQARAEVLGLAGAVTFHGFVPQAHAAALLRQADALVLPSLYECGGAVVLEAMASALPVIATRWGGPADYLDADCGFLIDPTSREALVTGFTRSMLQLARDGALGRAMGIAGRLKVAARFDWRAKVEHILALYHEVAGLPPPRRKVRAMQLMAMSPDQVARPAAVAPPPLLVPEGSER